MSDVSKFNLDGTDINVKDAVARTEASSATTAVSGLNTRVTALEQLSRLSVAYNSSTETITFTTTTPTNN